MHRVDKMILEQANVPCPGTGYHPVQMDGDFSNCKLDNMRWMADPERRAHLSTVRPRRKYIRMPPRAVIAWPVDDPSKQERFSSMQEAQSILEARLGKRIHMGFINAMCNNRTYNTRQTATEYMFKIAPDEYDDSEPGEEWRNVALPDMITIVSVSNLGRIRHPTMNYHLQGNADGHGRMVVTVNRQPYMIHRLIASAFCTQSHPKQTVVNHINGMRDDNRAVNLRWCTWSENRRFREEQGHSRKFGPYGIAVDATCEADGTSQSFANIRTAATSLSTDNVKLWPASIGARINPESSTYGAPYKGYVFKRSDVVL